MMLKRTAIIFLAVTAGLGCERLSIDESNAIALRHITFLLEGTGVKPESVRYMSELFPKKLFVFVRGDSTTLAAVFDKLVLQPTPVPDSIYLTSEFPINCSPIAEDFATRAPTAGPIDLSDGRRITTINALDIRRTGALCILLYYGPAS